MWQERADYGHFFYRIPNGESAADAYDRISGFNESLWRQFGEEDCASVCVLGTYALSSHIQSGDFSGKEDRRLTGESSNPRPNVPRLPNEMVPLQCGILRRPPQCKPLRIPHYAQERRLRKVHSGKQSPYLV